MNKDYHHFLFYCITRGKHEAKSSPEPQTQSREPENGIKESGSFHGYGFHTYHVIPRGGVQNINN